MEQDYPEYKKEEWSSSLCPKCGINRKKDGLLLCQRCMDKQSFGGVFTLIDQLNIDITEKKQSILDRRTKLVELKTRKLELEKELEIKKEEIQTRTENITKIKNIIVTENVQLTELERELLESEQTIRLHKDLVSNDIRVYISEEGTARLETHCTIVRPSESQEDLYFGHVTLKLTTDKDYIWHYGIEMYDKLPRKLEHSFWYDVEKVNSPEILYINDYGFKFPQGTTLSDIMKKHFEDCFKAFDRSQWTQIWSKDTMMTDGTKDVNATARLNRLNSQFKIRSAIKQSDLLYRERERKREQKEQKEQKEQDEQEKANRIRQVRETSNRIAEEKRAQERVAKSAQAEAALLLKEENAAQAAQTALLLKAEKAAEKTARLNKQRQESAEQSARDISLAQAKKESTEQVAESYTSVSKKVPESSASKKVHVSSTSNASTSKKQKANEEKLRLKQVEDALLAEALEAAQRERVSGVTPPQEQKPTKKKTIAEVQAITLCKKMIHVWPTEIDNLINIEESLHNIKDLRDLSRKRRDLIKAYNELFSAINVDIDVVKTYKLSVEEIELYLNPLIVIKEDTEIRVSNLLQIEQNYTREFYSRDEQYIDEADKSIIEHILVLRPNLTYNVVKTLVEKTRLKRENHLLATKDIIDIFLIDDMILRMQGEFNEIKISFDNRINDSNSRRQLIDKLDNYLGILTGYINQVKGSTVSNKTDVINNIYRIRENISEKMYSLIDSEQKYIVKIYENSDDDNNETDEVIIANVYILRQELSIEQVHDIVKETREKNGGKLSTKNLLYEEVYK